MFPENYIKMMSYYESRKKDSFNVFFGLSYYVKKYFGRQITQQNLEEFSDIANMHVSCFNRSQFQEIIDKHNGFFPVTIKAPLEGAIVESGNPLIIVENNDMSMPWVTNYIETVLSNIWYPITIATNSFKLKQKIKIYYEDTCDNLNGLDFCVHDFGARSATSPESAAIGGLANLTSFKGTDTIGSLVYGKKYYREECAGFSVPASEHSIMTCLGKEGEHSIFMNILNTYGYKSNAVSIVSDSYNVYDLIKWAANNNACRKTIDEMQAIMVFRPDSGHKVENPITIMELLNKEFGSKTNSRGYKVLNKVRVLQGNGINQKIIIEILKRAKELGFSADNFVFGLGGAMLQTDLNRDNYAFAFKACYGEYVNSKNVVKKVNIFKSPIDAPWKTSKAGKLNLLLDSDSLKFFNNLNDNNNHSKDSHNYLFEYYKNGKYVYLDLKSIRSRINEFSRKFSKEDILNWD
jgi:nicotinamide phosphoribosyltransferase